MPWLDKPVKIDIEIIRLSKNFYLAQEYHKVILAMILIVINKE